ncbi:SGNH/GDSL hydrolase family protein [Delftia sp. PS-11]|uniref:SGNH/GDSL hydrolase family protein n=1 Tax=Delftia sp. PS-11 TaxID=2767222 RepID=UPI002456F8C0|nr:SGNH/GDSL hydrolase family protein [Delftia sp. PS-11]KAJ8743409.1 SGNH/GDSL hydrolase family protein [Delftia sp. PS-11]
MATHFRTLAAALATTGLLAACGGGSGADTTPKAKVTAVKVMGDSLSDSGTFGYKFTVQNATPTGAGSNQVWAERVAGLYGMSLCPRFNGTAFTPNTACTNYAVGGGRINYTKAPTAPISITQQILAAGAAGFTADDLAVIDGGANDAADVIGAFLSASQDQGASFQALLGTKIDAATLGTLLKQGQSGMAQAGGLYMQTLAKGYVASIQTHVLGKGAMRVAILNVPAITLTPRFQMVLQSISQKQGSAAADQLATVFDGWVQAFNQQLSASFAGDSRVAIIDFYDEFKRQMADPAQYQYTNVKKAACPVAGIGSDGLPNYDFPTCTEAVLSKSIPVGETSADWWKSYSFSDSFHPTPYAHQQISQLASRTLARAGWL